MIINENDNYVIKPCENENIAEVMNFFGREWRSDHLLASHKKYVDYFFYNYERGNYNIIIAIDKKNADVIGILTYTTNTRFDSSIKDEDKFIWLCNWLTASDSYNGMGLSLYSGLVMYERAKNLGTVGCNERAKMIYKAMRYETGELKHFFLVNDSMRDYKVISDCKPNEARCLTLTYNNAVDLVRLDTIPDMNYLSDEFIKFIELAKPKKTLEYIRNKYTECFYREYFIYGIKAFGEICGLIVLRLVEHKNSKVLRIVDFIGNETNLAELYQQLQRLCVEFDAEYIDFYCAGIAEECLASSGFELNTDTGKHIVPDYFEPFLNKNIQIQYAYSFDGSKGKNEKFYVFRGDCDREHPNILGGSMIDKLINVINEFFGTDFKPEQKDEIKPEAFPQWDSLAHLNLVICIEDEFGVVFEPSEITEMLGGFDNIACVLSKKGVK